MRKRTKTPSRDRALDESKAIIADCWLASNLEHNPPYGWLARFMNFAYEKPLLNDGLEDVA